MRTALLAAAFLCLTPNLATGQDTAAGKTAYSRCSACHAVGENAKNGMGPMLNGVFGRQAGALEGFGYSKAMIEAGANGLIWTPETVGAFIHSPRDYLPGTKMAFAGLKDDEDIANVIAYLLEFSPDYTPEAAETSGPEEPGTPESHPQ